MAKVNYTTLKENYFVFTSTNERNVELCSKFQIRIFWNELSHEESGPGRQGGGELEVRVVDQHVRAPAEVHRQADGRRRSILQHERRQVHRVLKINIDFGF